MRNKKPLVKSTNNSSTLVKMELYLNDINHKLDEVQQMYNTLNRVSEKIYGIDLITMSHLIDKQSVEQLCCLLMIPSPYPE